LTRQCVESLLEKTTYPRFEILVLDNQSADSDALAYLEEIACYKQVRVLRYDHPFNYSAINNFAVREARGEIVCLLNNDTEVISPDWLEEMVGHLLQPKAGVVGAKLYFPDGRVQHAGDTVGPGGCANHLHSFIARNDPGYCNRAMVAQELSAVTAACLITWRELYQRLGGLNEKNCLWHLTMWIIVCGCGKRAIGWYGHRMRSCITTNRYREEKNGAPVAKSPICARDGDK